MNRTRLAAVRALCSLHFLLPVAAAATAPTTDLHELTWRVHIDLTDQGAGTQPLSYYADLIAEATQQASDLVEGGHGPFDTPCCAGLATVSVSVFGVTGDGLDVPSSASDFDDLDAIAGYSGSNAFLVSSLGWCGAPTTTAVGCGDRPGCDADPDDDPFLALVVTMEAYDVFDRLGATLAHERGHNACLGHVGGNACQIMSSSGGGGCLDAGECTNYLAGRTGSGGSCGCHAASGALADGAACTVAASPGVCSGALCGDTSSDASVRLLAAGGAGALVGETTDDALMLGAASGGWSDLGELGGGIAPQGLAYAPARGVVYGVAPTGGDDQLVTLDPITGKLITTLGTLTGIQDLIALAFDPGPSAGPGDDRLLALDDDSSSFEDLIEIDPDTLATNYLGGLSLGFSSGFHGLAYDSDNAVLYASSGANLYTIDPNSCPPGFCTTTNVAPLSLPRASASLAWSERTGRLYLVGNQSGNTRKLYDSVDPVTFSVEEGVGVDGFTSGGLAAVGFGPCLDGVDNDGDTLVDYPDDPGCGSPVAMREDPQCQDGLNNDPIAEPDPGLIDFDGGASLDLDGDGSIDAVFNPATPVITAPDPQCSSPSKNKEKSGCGLGFELALLIPVLARLRRRRSVAGPDAAGARP